jgi:hypothetical protein
MISVGVVCWNYLSGCRLLNTGVVLTNHTHRDYFNKPHPLREERRLAGQTNAQVEAQCYWVHIRVSTYWALPTYTCICVSIRQVALGVVIRTGTVIASNGVVTHTTFLIVTNRCVETFIDICIGRKFAVCEDECGVMVSVVWWWVWCDGECGVMVVWSDGVGYLHKIHSLP